MKPSEETLKENKNWVLGNTNTKYKFTYDKSKLLGMSRTVGGRREGYSPMSGFDIWTAFEFSFLLSTGLPFFGVIRVAVDCNTPNFFESKSFKLYLNTFNNTIFESVEKAIEVIQEDLSEVTQGNVAVWLVNSFTPFEMKRCLEKEYPNTECKDYTYNGALLEFIKVPKLMRQEFYSTLLRSNCEITNQPDWGTICVKMSAMGEVDEQSFLKYIVSFRNHQEFHEPTCERVFQNILKLANSEKLEVVCMYTRRGGIDINPIRFKEGEMIWGSSECTEYFARYSRQLSQ